MALVLADRVKETTTTTGTGTVTLAGVSAGYQSFAAIGNGNTTYYTISGQTTSEWEVGIGTYTSSGTTLSRTTVLSSSNGGSLVNFSAGTKDVFVTYPSGRSVNADAANTVVSVPQLSATSITDSGNLTFTGTGNRITGDFSNATIASRVMFQTSTANSPTSVSAIPSGTSAQADLFVFNSSDPNNASLFLIRASSTETTLRSGITGTGTYLPVTFYTSGTEKLRIAADATGTYTFGGTAPRITGDFSNATNASRVSFQTSTVNGGTIVQAMPNGTGTFGLFRAVGSSDPDNASVLTMQAIQGGTQLVIIRSDITGTGTYLPMTFYTSGSEKLRIAADATGTYTFGGTAPRITGDFTNATIANRVMFQTSTANSTTNLGLVPNGTGTASVIDIHNASDPTNAAKARMAIDGSGVFFASAINGTGTYLPMTFYTGGSERMRLDTSGNLGIGTTTPSSYGKLGLSVSATASAVTKIIGFQNSAGVDAASLRIAGYNYVDGVQTAIDFIQNSASNFQSQMAFSTNTGSGLVERMRIDSNGNVGIGTITPTALRSTNLEVYNASGASVVVGTASTSLSTLRLARTDATDGWDINYNYPVASMLSFNKLGTNAGPLFNIDSAGNVGIGTSAPTVPLNVVSSTTTTAGSPSIILQGSSNTERLQIRSATAGGGQPVTALLSARGSIAAPTATLSGDPLGYYQLGGYNGTAYSRAAWVSGFADGDWSATNLGSSIIFSTTPNGSTTIAERMRIDSAGNIRLGDAAVATNTLRFFDIYNSDTGGSSGAIIRLVTSNVAASGNTTVDIVKYKAGGFILNNNDTNAAVFTAFGVGASERMRIDASGDVGIGNSSPGGFRLNVTGSIYQSAGYATLGGYNAGTTGTSPVAGGISFSTNITNGQAEGDIWNGNDPASYANTGILFSQRLTSSTRRDLMFLHNSGNVGIGTNSPSDFGATGRVLQIQSTANNGYASLLVTSGGKTIEILVNNDAGVTNMGTRSNDVLGLVTNDLERMRIDTSGNVGIGQTSPQAKLQINTAADGAQIIVVGAQTGNEQTLLFRNSYYTNNATSGIAAIGWIDTGSSGGILTFKTGTNGGGVTNIPTERMRIDNTGIVTMSAYGAGAATFSAAGVISSVSDETWKIKDGVPVDVDSMLNKLEPGYWYYNDEKKEIFGVDRQLGFYAQNVNAAIGPEAAPAPEEGKPWGYYDRSVLAVTVMSLQKALATIESLTARIEALESR